MLMININRLSVISFFIAGLMLVACNALPTKEINKEPTKEEDPKEQEDLKEQSDNFDKSMENINDAMDLAKVLNEKIQMVEKQHKDGLITREKADQLINDLNERYSKVVAVPEKNEPDEFPEWLTELKITAPKGLDLNTNDSYQTKEDNLQDGYNSVLFIYTGSYQKAIAEAHRIAREANVPLSEPYQKAKDLADKLGKEIEGIDGITYVNYKFGDASFDGKYKISLSVDKTGKFTIHVVDEKMKNARKNAAGLPNIK